jgi:hypothetical protein
MILDLCVLQEAAGASPANHNAEPENERKTSMESRRANGFSFALESFLQVGNQEETMADALFVLITVSFFIVMWLYVRGCDRL